MSAPTYIIDNKLPLTQDFKSLKKEGLTYIQEYIGDEWTNLNASDPGVTILDQVCYALTELGYCNDFPVKDILTRPDGKLQVEDQFYLPENILTTSPLTIEDYIKYIVDGVDGVKNAIIKPVVDCSFSSCDVYQVYLLIDPSVTQHKVIKSVCKAAFYYLNKCRNIGELFLEPQPLHKKPWSIKGDVAIADKAELNTIIAAIDNAIQHYIFPAAIQSGYQQLINDGLDTNSIFSGPLLSHGWIPGENLGKKRDQLNTIELTDVISAVPGVKSVSGLVFVNTSIKPSVQSKPDELLVIDTTGVNYSWPGSENTAALRQLLPKVIPALAKSNIQLGASVEVQTDVPVGKFRDINNYYSIQNTFPGIFAVGADATVSGAANYQIAQSRQLKGYLTLFDQVLANQFSQLANIGRLFSFKNSLTGAPSDEHEYYAVKDSFEKEHPEIPVPYEIFSPTYFYQSLYDVPHIRPLLKGNDMFKFSTGLESENELDHKSWLEYKRDPYNPYMRGLMEFAEEEGDSLDRRNAILDHLLARHGESPLMINMIIDGSVYAGNSLKDRVIFKSLYLQNLGLLSYYRQKAYNYLGADKIPTVLEDVPVKLDHRIFGGTQHDFIFNSGWVNYIEKLTRQDFINYSAVELKLGLLLGLRSQYRDFIVHKGSYADKKLAFWMITRRRGFLFIEMDLLLRDAFFEVFVLYAPHHGEGQVLQQIAGKLKYKQLLAISRAFQQNAGRELGEMLRNGSFFAGGTGYKLTGATTAQENKRYRQIPFTDFSFTVRTNFQEGISFENSSLFDNRALAIFPSFIGQFNEKGFGERLDFFFQNTLPLPVTSGFSLINAHDLEKLVPVFTTWHNGLIYQPRCRHRSRLHYPPQITRGEQKYYAATLARLINDINPDSND